MQLLQYSSQNHSKKELSLEENEYFTCAKGGYAILLSRFFFKTDISQNEYEALYQFGGLIQLADDIFDISRDLRNGIYTLPNNYLTVTETGYKLNEYFIKFINKVKKTDHNKRFKRKIIYRAFILYILSLSLSLFLNISIFIQ